MTAPEPRPAGADGNARGLLVLGIGVLVGFLLLWNAGAGGGSGATSSTDDQTSGVDTSALADDTSTTAATTTTAATSSHQPSEVKVLVLNGGGPTGAAADTSNLIGQSGYVMGDATNSPVNVEATTFLYTDGYQEDATQIALLLGKSTDAVKDLAELSLSGVEGDANVVVILGPDAPPVSDSSSDTTTTTTA